MIGKTKQVGFVFVIIFIFGASTGIAWPAGRAKGQEPLTWGIKANKETYYPGEPVLLTLTIRNTGDREEKVDFGMDGIEAFSMEIRDSSDNIVAERGHIQRFGLSRVGTLTLRAGARKQKVVVLNQWCSTLLAPGKYNVVCRIDSVGRFFLEKVKSGNEEVILSKRDYSPMVTLDLDIQIVKGDDSAVTDILKGLAGRKVRKEGQNKGEWLREWRTAREMIAFAESPLAVRYQLDVLKVEPSTWLKRDVINSLARSGAVEAAVGLMEIAQSCPRCGVEDVKREIIDAVYRLRETGKEDILAATENFVQKHKRPGLGEIID